MRVLITGDRNWDEYAPIYTVLKALHDVHPDAIIVHGGARGADTMAGQIAAVLFGTDRVEAYPAEWTKYGKSAGPIRNRLMVKESQRRGLLDGHMLERGVAFHHHLERSKGTKDMVSVLEYHGIKVLKIG